MSYIITSVVADFEKLVTMLQFAIYLRLQEIKVNLRSQPR
jgi:hypothetical protein